MNYGLQSLENVEDKNDDPLPFSSHEYETMNPLIRDDGKNPSASASEKLNHKPSNADGTHEENPFNMNFNKMESDANYGKLKAMKGNILSLNHILESGLSQHILFFI